MKIEVKLENGKVLKCDCEKYEDIPDEIKVQLEKNAEKLIKGGLNPSLFYPDIFGTNDFFYSLFGINNKSDIINNMTINKSDRDKFIPDRKIMFAELTKEEQLVRIMDDIENRRISCKINRKSRFLSRRGRRGKFYDIAIAARNESKDNYFFSVALMTLEKKGRVEPIILHIFQCDEYPSYGEALFDYMNNSDWALDVLLKLIEY